MLISSTQHEEIRRTTGRRWESIVGQTAEFCRGFVELQGIEELGDSHGKYGKKRALDTAWTV